MSRLACVGVAVGIVLAAAGCGGQTTYTLARTKSCLVQHGAEVGGKLDFVAETATGGALRTSLKGNSVTIAFGQTLTDGKELQLAYERFASPNVRSGLPDVLRRYDNAVTLWHVQPTSGDLSLVVGCLR